MKRLLVCFLVFLSTIFSAAAPTSIPATAESGPEYRQGFRTLAGMIPEIMGDPLESEHYDADGNSIQRTTRGLAVWRKADNWTAFTDGASTWINGPEGVQTRPNDQRFPWEAASSVGSQPQRTAPARTAVPTPTPQRPRITATPIPARPTATPAPTRQYTADVKAMDSESGGPGVTISTLMKEIDQDFTRAWGWRPNKPTTVYLYSDGYRMADGIQQIGGQRLSASERELWAGATGVSFSDAQTGGWAITLNVKDYYGGPTAWASSMKGTLAHEYAHTMQQDIARGAGPMWLIEGMAELSNYAAVPSDPGRRNREYWVYQAYQQGVLIPLSRIQTHEQFNSIVQGGDELTDEVYGISYLSVKYLADRVGGMPLLKAMTRTAGGQDFDAALQAETGMTTSQLDAAYRKTITAP